MSPSRDHGVAETIHLTEQNFDEALAATDGLVMVASADAAWTTGAILTIDGGIMAQ